MTRSRVVSEVVIIMAGNRAGASWMVHATVDEPVSLLCAYAAHYLSLGASEVHFFLDRPTEEAQDVLGRVDGVRLTRCDAAYWGTMFRGARPAMHVKRQFLNANLAYAECRTDWFLFCDADEFLHSPENIGAVLAAQSAATGFLRIPVAERAFPEGQGAGTIFDGVLRRRLLDAAILDAAYGEDVVFFSEGLLGHTFGKSITRAGRDYSIKLHVPVEMENGKALRRRKMESKLSAAEFPGAELVHFDGLTPLHWVLKLLHKYASSLASTAPGDGVDLGKRRENRVRQIEQVYRARKDPAALRRLLRLPYLDDQAQAVLARCGALGTMPVDPVAAVKTFFPHVRDDYSAEAFDRSLRALHRDLIAQTGLAI